MTFALHVTISVAALHLGTEGPALHRCECCLSLSNPQVDIMQMCVVEMADRPGKPLFHLEHYIEGKYIKYNSNSGFVRDDNIRLTPQVGDIPF